MVGDSDEEVEEVIRDISDELMYAEINWSSVKRHGAHPLELERAERAIAIKKKTFELLLKATKGMSLEEYGEDCAKAVALEEQKKKLKQPRSKEDEDRIAKSKALLRAEWEKTDPRMEASRWVIPTFLPSDRSQRRNGKSEDNPKVTRAEEVGTSASLGKTKSEDPSAPWCGMSKRDAMLLVTKAVMSNPGAISNFGKATTFAAKMKGVSENEAAEMIIDGMASATMEAGGSELLKGKVHHKVALATESASFDDKISACLNDSLSDAMAKNDIEDRTELSSGVISSHIERGCLPPQNRAIFQVVATKPIPSDSGCMFRFNYNILLYQTDKTQHNIICNIFRLAITDGIDTYRFGLLLVENPSDLPQRNDILNLGYKSPGARFENMIKEGSGKAEIKVYVIHNFKIMRKNRDGMSFQSGTHPMTYVEQPSDQVRSAKRPKRKYEYNAHYKLGAEQIETGMDVGRRMNQALLPYRRIGKIEVDLKTILGKGAFGTVYQGKYEDRDVAIKRVTAGINIDREAHLHMRCDDHPNVCRYFGMEKDPFYGDTLLVMELCLGTLADYVVGKFSVARQPKGLLEDATQGLDHLHRKGIVHRDINPHNILISRPMVEGGPVRAVIADFGFSKELKKDEQSFSISEGWRGTLSCMAPEVLTNQEEGSFRATMAVDVYALGCVFFYTLTKGKPLFYGKDDVEVMSNIKNGLYDLAGLVQEFLHTESIEEADEEVLTYVVADYCHEVNAVPFVHSSAHRKVTDLFTSHALIACMISHVPSSRPPLEAVLKHPYFWSVKDKLEYIELVSDHLRESNRTSAFYQDLERCKSDILGTAHANWSDLIRHFHPDLNPIMNYVKNPPPDVRRAWYNFESVASILRLIRNFSHHLSSLPQEVKAVIQGSSLTELFTGIFPRLLVFTWLVMSDEADRKPGLNDFYHDWWRGRTAYIYQSLTDGGGRWPLYKPISIPQAFRCMEEPDGWS